MVADALVVWVAPDPNDKMLKVVGWYKNATVYRDLQSVPENVLSCRKHNELNRYYMNTTEAVLVTVNERCKIPKFKGRDLWYAEGQDELNDWIIRCTDEYEADENRYVHEQDIVEQQYPGGEIKRTVKEKINQDKFRNRILCRYNYKCCICGMDNDDLVVASHIKPWSQCQTPYEKTDTNNVLLLCAMHDKLFDDCGDTF